MSQDSRGPSEPPDPYRSGQPGTPDQPGPGQPGQTPGPGQSQPGQGPDPFGPGPYPQGQYGPGPGQAPPPPSYYGGIPEAPRPPSGPGSMPGTEQNSLGVWALVLGIASFVCGFGFITGIPAIILGRKAQQAEREGRANNGSLGTAGVVLGWIAVVLSALAVLAVILFAATGTWGLFMQGVQESVY